MATYGYSTLSEKRLSPPIRRRFWVLGLVAVVGGWAVSALFFNLAGREAAALDAYKEAPDCADQGYSYDCVDIQAGEVIALSGGNLRLDVDGQEVTMDICSRASLAAGSRLGVVFWRGEPVRILGDDWHLNGTNYPGRDRSVFLAGAWVFLTFPPLIAGFGLVLYQANRRSTPTPARLVPPGWYPNPAGTGSHVWWDGQRWWG